MPIFNLLPTYGLVAEITPTMEDLLPTYGLVLGSQEEEPPPPSSSNPPLITLVT
jgi:hypothetical protein